MIDHDITKCHTILYSSIMLLRNNIKQMVDMKVLHDYVNKGLVKFQCHPRKDLIIWNYTDVVQMKQLWDDVTCMTRGFITDTKGTVVARSFPKFHNIEQNLHTASPRFKVYEKLDGSLGILFCYENEWIVSSRGSFTSDQAHIAQEMISNKYDISSLDRSFAYSFEIIHPNNRIVVDYGDREELVFLAAFSRDGEEHTDVCENMIRSAGFPIARTYEYDDYKTIKQLNWKNAEGFVVRFDNGERVKIKFEDYLHLHRIVTNLNALTVWERFASGVSLELAIENIPDEFHEWYAEKFNGYVQKYQSILAKHRVAFEQIYKLTNTRKDFACAVQNLKDPDIIHKILFSMYNNKDVHVVILDMVRPIEGVYDVPTCKKANTQSYTTKQSKSMKGSLFILIGPSGSGKSTWAAEYINKHKDHVRVNRDMLRKQLYGSDDLRAYHMDPRKKQREKCVTDAEMTLIDGLLAQGYSVVIDNTNLRKEYIDAYVKRFGRAHNIEFQLFTDIPYDMCVSRDADRPEEERVGCDVIKKQFDMMHVLISKYSFSNTSPETCKHSDIIEQNVQLPKGYVFDIDGTLADNSGRDPYDWSKVEDDEVIEATAHTLRSHRDTGHRIVICSGRDAVCEAPTVAWLKKHDIPYDRLYMRPKGDRRPDWIVKEEMWRDISKTMCIIAMYDDRDSVVRHGRACGLKVYQVAYGNF